MLVEVVTPVWDLVLQLVGQVPLVLRLRYCTS